LAIRGVPRLREASSQVASGTIVARSLAALIVMILARSSGS
jgi:hypothetical protein